MEGQVKSFSLQNTAGVSKEKDVAVISQTTEANGDQVSNVKNKTTNASILLIQSNPSVLKFILKPC